MTLITPVAFMFATALSLNPAGAATKQTGGGLGFTCDVNTKQCKCEGTWEGADCQAMKKNCAGDSPISCRLNKWCICNLMIRVKPNSRLPLAPLNKKPALKIN
jgi:hypothetical protein